MAKEKEIVIEVMANGLTEDMFEEFFPETHEEQNMVFRGQKRNFIPIEEIPDPKSMVLESEKGWEEGWSAEALLSPVKDTSPFFNVDILDIQNGKEENMISLPKFVSFAKCKRKRF